VNDEKHTASGVSICWSIIDAHDGQLWVTADKGRGFSVHGVRGLGNTTISQSNL